MEKSHKIDLVPIIEAEGDIGPFDHAILYDGSKERADEIFVLNEDSATRLRRQDNGTWIDDDGNVFAATDEQDAD